MARTRRVDCNAAGIRRRRHGRGFSYEWASGGKVDDPLVVERIRALAIPPAWEDVWICPIENGHIQATGIDDAGRKQYLYHQAWRENRDRAKFAEMEGFAKALPRLRERINEDLGRRGLVRERVLACGIGLLDHGLFRVGSERYATDNGTFGLTTLERHHLRIERGAAVFDYKAKGGKRHRIDIAGPELLPTLRALKARRGGPRDLLAYRSGREWRDVVAEDINQHLRDLAGGEYSAKDFRTWNATVLAALALAEHATDAKTKAARKRAADDATSRVAELLSNTPAVSRSSYIDPRVFDRFDAGETIRPALSRIVGDADETGFPERERIERAVLRLLAS